MGKGPPHKRHIILSLLDSPHSNEYTAAPIVTPDHWTQQVTENHCENQLEINRDTAVDHTCQRGPKNLPNRRSVLLWYCQTTTLLGEQMQSH